MALWTDPQAAGSSGDAITSGWEPGLTAAVSVLRKLKQFCDEDKLCDAYIHVKDSTFRAQKCILAAWSPVFAKELFAQDAELKVVLHLDYPNAEAVAGMLEYFYTCELTLSDTDIIPLCDLAKNFSIKLLSSECEQFLQKDVTMSNFLSKYFISLKYNFAALQYVIMNFIEINVSSVIDQAEFLSMSPVFFKTFLTCGAISQMPHAIMFTLIISWVGHDLSRRDQLLMYFLGRISWNHSVSDLLLQISKSENIFSTSDICMFQLLQSLTTSGHNLGTYLTTYQTLLAMYSHLIEDLKHPKVFMTAETALEAVAGIPFTVHAEPNTVSSQRPATSGNNPGITDAMRNMDVDSSYFAESVESCNISHEPKSDPAANSSLNAAVVNKSSPDFKGESEILTFQDSSKEIYMMKSDDISEREVCQDSLQTGTEICHNSACDQSNAETTFPVEPVREEVQIGSENEMPLINNTLEKLCESAGITAMDTASDEKVNSNVVVDLKKDEVVDKIVVKNRRKSQPRKLSINSNVEEKTEKRGRGRPRKYPKVSTLSKENENGLVAKAAKEGSVEEIPSLGTFQAEKPKTTSRRSRMQRRSVLKQERLRITKTKERNLNMQKHEKHSRQRFVCTYDDCDFTSRKEENLERHIEYDHNPNIKLNCQRCDYSTCCMREFCVHMKTHFNKMPYTCINADCQQQFMRMGILVRHEMTHMEEKPYKCDLCDKSFGTPHQLKCHRKLHEGRQFECDVCLKRFTTKGAMQQHRGIHFDNKPYLCDTCGFSTKHLSHLISHRKIHSGDVLRCSFPNCTYTTPKQGHMTQHVNTHLNIRNHICQVCGKSFVVRGKLLRHERIHLKEKLFRCKQCDYQTSRTDRMKLHIESHGIKFKKKKFNLPAVEEEKLKEDIDYHQLYEKNTPGEGDNMLTSSVESSDLPYSSLSLVSMADIKPMDAISLAASASMIVDTFSPVRLGIVDQLNSSGQTTMSLEDFQNAGYQLKWVSQTATFENM